MKEERRQFQKWSKQSLIVGLFVTLVTLFFYGGAAWAEDCECGDLEPYLCAGTCVDIDNDPFHCGGCGQSCREGMVCKNRVCECPTGFSDAGGKCVDFQTDFYNCGFVGNTCTGGKFCNNGSCVCPIGLSDVGGICVDFQTDINNCGSAGRACAAGKRCDNGRCLTSCPSPTPTVCFSRCIDTQVDVNHCGSCGNECAEGMVCRNGHCGCPIDLFYAGGKCVDLQTDEDHCGSAGHACAAGRRCVGGHCVLSCGRKEPTSCFGECVDTQTDVNHCGSCGNACLAGDLCTAGVCTCPGGLTRHPDGQCVDLQTDEENCGSIGNTCSEMQRCTDGECMILGNIPGDADGDSIVGISDVIIDLRILAGVPTAPEIPTVFSSATDRTWMDRNLGASQVATSPVDSAAFGDLYQWGRLSDGHENRNSGITGALASGDVPGHGDFIVANSGQYDWRDPQNDSLWRSPSRTNNPCPDGFRLPTEAEWVAERNSWVPQNPDGAFASPLKIVLAGARSRSDGSLNNEGVMGRYWSETVIGIGNISLYLYGSDALIYSDNRAEGFSVRCIKD